MEDQKPIKQIVPKAQDFNLVCPHCKAEHNALSGDAMPKDGDLSFCAECVSPAIIMIDENENIRLRAPLTREEWEECMEVLTQFIQEGEE